MMWLPLKLLGQSLADEKINGVMIDTVADNYWSVLIEQCKTHLNAKVGEKSPHYIMDLMSMMASSIMCHFPKKPSINTNISLAWQQRN